MPLGFSKALVKCPSGTVALDCTYSLELQQFQDTITGKIRLVLNKV